MRYHLVAFLVVAVWGSTFVFTKILLQAGMTPAQIFTFRFLIAYVLMLPCSWAMGERRWMTDNWRDELLMVALGVTGGSLYFLTENAAMLYTTATNTSLIVCSCPLFAMLLVALVYRKSERITRIKALGSIIACIGMAVVVLNGHFVLHLSPLGDALAFAACLCWAFYSLLMKAAIERYSDLFITRKVFFYGLLTIIPYFICKPEETAIFNGQWIMINGQCSMDNVQWPIIGSLLFLGIVASLLCFLVWNWVIRKLGAVVATNWVYFNPITTIVFAAWLLREPITPWFLLGTVLILLGMYLCDRRVGVRSQGV
ncbi:MAG: DMT family transporter [Prevotella sp.]|nr:DMT family transporter [Prevotella sp.]